MGAAALGLALMAGSNVVNESGQEQALFEQGKVASAENARQQALQGISRRNLQQLTASQAPGSRLPAIGKIAATEQAPLAAASDTTAKAFGQVEGGTPGSSAGALSQAVASAGDAGTDRASMLARLRAPGLQQQQFDNAFAQNRFQQRRLQAQAEDSASVLPWELRAAGFAGGRSRAMAQLMALAGQYGYSKGIYQPGGYSNSTLPSNRLQGPAQG